jgi:hypothetical protein
VPTLGSGIIRIIEASRCIGLAFKEFQDDPDAKWGYRALAISGSSNARRVRDTTALAASIVAVD